jgi:hypothetical protein
MATLRQLLVDLRPYLTRYTLAGTVLVAVVLLVVVLSFLLGSRPDTPSIEESTAVIAVIPAPSLTPSPSPTSPITPTATLDVPPSPQPGELVKGSLVQISGTGGDGLRLRTGAGLNFEVGFLGLEAEVFQIIDGPQDADGYTWWLLEAPYDEGQQRRGWAVANYLITIQNP